MGPQEDYIELVLTCEGDFYDPNFHVHLEDFSNRLQDLITGGQRKLVLKKVEPWNSVRVTFNIPKDAAVRLKQLAEQGSQTLRELGVLAVQIEGDRVISLTIANKDNETTHLVFRTADSEPAAGSSTANSVYNLSNTHDLPSSSTSCAHNPVSHDDIEQYLKQKGVANTGFFDSIFNQPGAGPGFPSPNVVAPPNEPLPFAQNRNIMQNKRQQANRHNNVPAVPEPYPFAPANISVGHGLMQTNVNSPAFVAARNSTTYMPPPPPEVTATVGTPGQTHANFPSSLSHMSPKFPTPPPSVSTPGSPMPPSGAHFPHHLNPHQLASNPNMVNMPRMMVMPPVNKGITSSSPLLVNLLQSDAAGHFNHLPLAQQQQLQQQQLQQQQQQLKVRPPFESTSPAKRKSRKTKKQRDSLSKGARAEQGSVADQDVTNQLTSIYSALAQNRVPSIHQDFDGHSSTHIASAVPKQIESTVTTGTARQSSATSMEGVKTTVSQQAARQSNASSAAGKVTDAVMQQASRNETTTTAMTTTQQIVNPYTGQLEPIDTNPDSCDDIDTIKQSGNPADVTSHALPLECLHPPPNPLVALHSGMLHERMQKDSEVQPSLSVVNRTVNLAITSAAQSAEGQVPAASRNTTVMTSPVTSMGSAKWTDSHAQQTASFGIGPALQLRGPQVVFPPGMSTEARIEHLLRSANMSLAASADVPPPPYSVAASKAPGFTTSAAVTSLEQAFGNSSTTMFPSGPTQTFSHSMQQQRVIGIPLASSAVGPTPSVSTPYTTAMQKMQAVNLSTPQGVYTMCLPAVVNAIVVNPAVDVSHSLPRTAGEFLSSLANRTSSVESSTLQAAAGKLPVMFAQAALNSMANAVETSATLVTVNQTTMSPCVNSAVISNMVPVAADNHAVTSAGSAVPASVEIASQSPCGLSASALPLTCGYDLMNGTITAASITAAGISVPPVMSVESHTATPVPAKTGSLSSAAGTIIKTESVASSTVTHPTDSGNSINVTPSLGSVAVTSMRSDATNFSCAGLAPWSLLSSHSTCVAVVMTTTNVSPISTVTAPGPRLLASCLHPELTTTVTSVLSSRVTDNVQQHQNTNATTRTCSAGLEEKLLHRQVSSSQPNSAVTVHSAIPHTSSGIQRHARAVKLSEGNMQIENGGRSEAHATTLSGNTSEQSSADPTHHLAPCVGVYTANSRLSAVTVPHLNHDSDLSSQSACDADSSTSTQQVAVENHRQSPPVQDSESETTLKHPTDKEAAKATLVKTGDNVITVGFAISKEQSAVDLSSTVLSEKLCVSDGDIVPFLSKPLHLLKRQQGQGVCMPKTCVMEKLLLKNPDVRTTAPSKGADQPVGAVYNSVKPCVSCVQSGRSETQCAGLSGGCRLEGRSNSAVNGDETGVTTCALGQERAYIKRKDGTCFGASSIAGDGCIDRTVACLPAVSHCATKEMSSSSNVPSRDAGLLQQQMSHSANSESPMQQEGGHSEDTDPEHLHQRQSGEPLQQPTTTESCTPPTDVTSTSVRDVCPARTASVDSSKQHSLQPNSNSLQSAHIPLPAGESPALSLAGPVKLKTHEATSISDVTTSMATSVAFTMVSVANVSVSVVAKPCVANVSRYSHAGQVHSNTSTATVASTSGGCTAHSGLPNRLAPSPSSRADTVTSSLRDDGTLPMVASRCSYTAVTPGEASTTTSHPGLVSSNPAVCCSSPLSFFQQSTGGLPVGTTLLSAISKTKLYRHCELASPSNPVSSSAEAVLVMNKHLTCHLDITVAGGRRGFNANYDVNTTVVNDQAVESVPAQNALGTGSEEHASSGCVPEEASKGSAVDQLLQKCINESFSKDVSAYMSEKDISQVHAKLADKLKQRNKKNQAVFNAQRSDAVVYNMENLKQVNAVLPTMNNLQTSSASSTSLSTVFPHNSPYYSSTFLNKSLHMPPQVNSVQHPITAPSFPLNLTQSVLKLVKAIPCTDTTPPPSPKPVKVSTASLTRSRPLPLSHSSSQSITTMEKVQLNRPGVHMETLGEIKSVVIENRPLNHDRVIVKVEKLSEAKMKEMKAAAAAKMEETTVSAVAAQPECLVTEHSYSVKTDSSSPLKDADEKTSPPAASNEVSSTETGAPQKATMDALPAKLDVNNPNTAVAVTTIKAEKLANADSSHMNCNDITINGMIDEPEDMAVNLHVVENAERTIHDLSPAAKSGRGVKRNASGDLSPAAHDNTQTTVGHTGNKTELIEVSQQQHPDDNHISDTVVTRRQSHESTESHSSNPDGGTRWKKSMSESSETSSTGDSISSEVRCSRGGACRRSADLSESPMSQVTRISTRSSTRKKQPTIDANDTAEVPPTSSECGVSPKSLPKNVRGVKRKCVMAATEMNDIDKKTPEMKNKVASPTSDADTSSRPKVLPHLNKSVTILDDKVVAPSSVKGRKHHADSVMIDINEVPTSAGGQDSAAIPSEVAKKTRTARPGATKNIDAELVVICEAKDVVDKATKQANARVKGAKADLKELPQGDQPAFKRATRSSKAKVDHCELPPPPSKRRRPVKEHR